MTAATLLISCPDRKGIVAGVSQLLYARGANILDADQHTDPVAGMFFQRILFELDGDGERPALEAALRELAGGFGMDWRIAYATATPRVAILCSKQEHCVYDLLVRHRAGELACTPALVISNHADLGPVARHFDVPFHHLPVTNETRAAQETEILRLLEASAIDVVVLARYMQILSPRVVDRYPTRIINIHHSFLPAFIGANPYRQAYERGVKLIGATAHYVTAELDNGPIIEQALTRCSHRDSVDELVRKGRDLEKRVLGNAVRLHLQDRVLVYAGKTVVF